MDNSQEYLRKINTPQLNKLLSNIVSASSVYIVDLAVIDHNYQHLINKFSSFLLEYLSNINISKYDKRHIRDIMADLKNSNSTVIYNALITLIGGIRNYNKINSWGKKRIVNIPNNLNFNLHQPEINDIVNRLENGIGFNGTNYLSKKLRIYFLKKDHH